MKNNSSQKGFAMPITIAIIAIVLVLSGFVYYSNKSNEAEEISEEEVMMEKEVMAEKEAMEQKEKEVIMEKKDGEMIKKDNEAMIDKGETMMKYSGVVLAGKSASLLDFVKADYDAAIKTDKLVVLYFYANWCPSCKAEFPLMQDAFNGLTTDKVIGFRVNYNDNATDSNEKTLAQQFGVAYQHTKVFVKNGNRILKSPEGWDKNRYTSEINKALTQ
ncbi:MAG: thioredoxin family protein [Patescibacteria group bacterium]